MNNEAILNKLIELGYVKEHPQSSPFNTRRDSDYLIVQRALFDECAKRDYFIQINSRNLYIRRLIGEEIHQGDTSRESFVKAFCKVVGVSCDDK